MNKTTIATTKLSVGKKVKWTSQANGNAKTKIGTIAAMVKAGQTPAAKKFAGLRVKGAARKVPSYIVNVGGKFYWPRTSQLNKA